jgi:hypothetical protein
MSPVASRFGFQPMNWSMIRKKPAAKSIGGRVGFFKEIMLKEKFSSGLSPSGV